jgi:hypothetical protein
MSGEHGDGRALSRRQYQWLDRVTKLAGVGLVAVGLEVGGSSVSGIVLAALGVTLGLVTVFIDTS